MDTDVLIVGAGPTGLMLANQLARRSVRALIIDRHTGPAQQTRALGVQARTLEIYAQLGIADRALALGKPGTGGNLWAQGRWMARVPLSDAGAALTPYPYILILGQDDNERLMGNRLHDFGVSVQWNTELIALEQHADRVGVTLKQPDGSTRKLTAAWVAGCDGARSAVREMNGITFPGAPYEHVFYVADVEATGTMKHDEVNVYLWRDGFDLFFPMRGKDHWRLVGILPPKLRQGQATFDDVVPSLRGQAGSTLSFKGCNWFSTYRIAHRAASRFREGRCFVLGDAAHIHSPVGAQGMNTGLQDAYNLAWKLALVVQGRADAALLDSYERERLPVAQRLLNTTDRGFRVIVSDSRLAGLFRTTILARIGAFAMGFARIQKAAFNTVSQLGINYRESPLSQSLDRMPEDAPHAGDRFPWLKLRLKPGGTVEDIFRVLIDTEFSLVVVGQALATDAASVELDALNKLVIPPDATNDAELSRAGIPSPSFYLVRPDGYIGLCGGRIDPDAIRRYFADTVQLTSGSGVEGRAPAATSMPH